MGPKKPKKQQEPDDQFMKMVASELDNNLKLMKERVNELKSKRNYIQMDRDMVQQFYKNTELQIEELQTEILNKQAQAEKMTVQHNKEVKVFLQRLKLLEYEQEKSNISIEEDGEEAKVKENDYFENRMKKMKKAKSDFKSKQTQVQKLNFDEAAKLEDKHFHNKKIILEENDQFLENTEKGYQQKLAKMKEDLELKLKVDIHELQQRKNLHINELIKNHEAGFEDLRTYYNQITRDNLKLIKDHKADIKKINEQSEKNKQKIAELKEKNNAMKQPLHQARLQSDRLKSLLRQFQKHKMSLQNYKSKYTVLKEKVIKVQKQFADLSEKYDKVMIDKKQLSYKFQSLTKEVKKHAQMHNVVLMRKLEAQNEQLQQKEAYLQQLMQNSSLPPDTVEEIKAKVKESIESKNQTIKNLKYSIHHATKAYNDAIRVYEAKLVQFGIPSEELGFQPLQTITSSMPAGLVSS